MKLAFYIAKNGDWRDKIIAWWTRPNKLSLKSGKYSHVEMVFKNNLWVASSPRYGGVRVTNSIDINSGSWDIIDTELGDKMEEVSKYIDYKYDWLAIFGFSIPNAIEKVFKKNFMDTKKKVICSEFVCKMYPSLIEGRTKLSPHQVSPNKLYEIVKKSKR